MGDDIRDGAIGHSRGYETVQSLLKGQIPFPYGEGYVKGLFPAESHLHMKPVHILRGKGYFIAHENIGHTLPYGLDAVRFKAYAEDVDVIIGRVLFVVVVSGRCSDGKAVEVLLRLQVQRFPAAVGTARQGSNDRQADKKGVYNGSFHIIEGLRKSFVPFPPRWACDM